VDLKYLSFGLFLSTQPHWNGTEQKRPLPIEAAIELRSPILHGLPLGKVAYLESVLVAGFDPATPGPTHDDPLAAHLRNKRSAADRAVSAARQKLQRNPAPLGNDKWTLDYAGLNSHAWSIFLDGVYAAHVESYAAPGAGLDLACVASVTYHGSARWVADALRPAEAGPNNRLLELVEYEFKLSAEAFNRTLA
jgi:hypothetical protein